MQSLSLKVEKIQKYYGMLEEEKGKASDEQFNATEDKTVDMEVVQKLLKKFEMSVVYLIRFTSGYNHKTEDDKVMDYCIGMQERHKQLGRDFNELLLEEVEDKHESDFLDLSDGDGGRLD